LFNRNNYPNSRNPRAANDLGNQNVFRAELGLMAGLSNLILQSLKDRKSSYPSLRNIKHRSFDFIYTVLTTSPEFMGSLINISVMP